MTARRGERVAQVCTQTCVDRRMTQVWVQTCATQRAAWRTRL